MTARSPSAPSNASAAAATHPSSRSTTATGTTPSPRTCPRSSRSSVPARSMLLAGVEKHDLTTVDGYRAVGGYDALPKARAISPDDLIAELQTSNLRGRG